MDTLTRMRAFIDVVEAEGFSAAARKIGRSKALLSKYVRELEDELGALLLNRTTRQFSLTEAGHTYFQRATQLVKEIDSLQEAVRDASGDVKGRIKLSAPRTLADTFYGQSLIDFAVAHPDIILDIRLDDRFVDLVEEGFDLAIRITRMEDSSLIVRRLAPFSILPVASPELIAKNREALTQLIQLAWHDLEEARNYLLLIPRRAISIRLFCILPLLLAYATLRDLVQSTAMLKPGGSVKISRREVKSLLMTGAMLVMSNSGVRWLVARVRRRAFELGFA